MEKIFEVVRDIFGTRPYHLLPREQRVFNPYQLYRKYLGGAKILLLPLTLVFGLLRVSFAGIRHVSGLIDEVLGRKKVLRSQLSRVAGFDVAVRKINRMRKPFYMEALWLRAAVDVEYLGLRLPGVSRDGECASWKEDLDYIGALQAERKPLRELRNRAVKDFRRFRNLLTERGWSGARLDRILDEIDPSGKLCARRGEVVRALVTAYVTDHRSLRSLVTAAAKTRKFAMRSLGEERPGWWKRLEAVVVTRLFARATTRRRRQLFDEYAGRHAYVRDLPAEKREQLWGAFVMADRAVEENWRLTVEAESVDESGEDRVLRVLKEVACEYAAWTRRLVTVRTVQTLTVLDIRSYRDMVWDVGEYADD